MRQKIFLMGIILWLMVASFLNPQEEQKPQPWDGSRTTAVHLIPLKDEFEQPILRPAARENPGSLWISRPGPYFPSPTANGKGCGILENWA